MMKNEIKMDEMMKTVDI